ncbi:hypothetical protein ABPG74_016704 [Tetrahymena malaccensis]
MISKIVLTEKGLKLSSELLTVNPDDPPPFLEEGKPIQRQISTPKIANLFEKSNGFLDRVTLKSAQSNRQVQANKPFFLPNYDYQEVFNVQPSSKQSKYPGIYPPKTSEGKNRIKLSQNAENLTSSNSLKAGINQMRDQQFMQTGLMMGSHPLILDYETISKQQQEYTQSRKQSQQQTFFQRQSQQGIEDGTFHPFDSQQGTNKRMLPVLQQSKSNQFLSSNQQVGYSEESPSKKDGLQKLQFNNKIDDFMKSNMGTTTNNKFQIQTLQHGRQMPVNRQQHEKSIKERMDLKKQTYLHHRELQDKKLKEIAQKRSDLSKDPVHIAAKYLQELKKEDQTVENLLFDVNYFKSRYKNRLQEYHQQKYQKKWNKYYFPSENKRSPSPKDQIINDQLEEDLLNFDQSSYKPSMKSYQKQNSINSHNVQ